MKETLDSQEFRTNYPQSYQQNDGYKQHQQYPQKLITVTHDL